MDKGACIHFKTASDNVVIATMDRPVWLDNTLRFDRTPYHYFRDGVNANGEITYAYIARPPSELGPDDSLAINEQLDAEEGAHNRAVKKLIAHSLSLHFNYSAFHLTELGCGRYPLIDYFKPASAPAWHGIDSDPACVSALKARGLSASENTQITKPADKPAVATAIYALHYLVNAQTPALINDLTGANGFFIGNYYTHPREEQTKAERRKLSALIEQAGLAKIILRAPNDPHNDYWIIGRKDALPTMQAYADSLSEANRSLHGKAMRKSRLTL